MGTRNPLSLFREEETGRKEPIGGFRSQGPSSSDEGTKEKNARETTQISQKPSSEGQRKRRMDPTLSEKAGNHLRMEADLERIGQALWTR
jgi:hypothetical protein